MVIRPLKPNEMTELFKYTNLFRKLCTESFANFTKLSKYDAGRHNRTAISYGMRLSHAAIPIVAQRSVSIEALPVNSR